MLSSGAHHFHLIYRSLWSRIFFYGYIYINQLHANCENNRRRDLFIYISHPFFSSLHAQPFLTCDDHEKVSRLIRKVKFSSFIYVWLCLCATKYVNEFHGFYHWLNDVFDIPKIAFSTFLLLRLQSAQHDTILISALRLNAQRSHIHGIDVRPYHIFSRYIDIPTLHTANMIARMEWALAAAVIRAQSIGNYVVFQRFAHGGKITRYIYVWIVCLPVIYSSQSVEHTHENDSKYRLFAVIEFFFVMLNIYYAFKWE